MIEKIMGAILFMLVFMLGILALIVTGDMLIKVVKELIL